MGRLTPDEFRAKYAALPANLREAYSSIKTGEILEEIGKKHGLHIDDLGSLIDETGYVMLGVTPPQEYIKHLAGALEIPREKAKELAVDVNERVFKPIRDALKSVHKVGEHAASAPRAAAPPPMPPTTEPQPTTRSATPSAAAHPSIRSEAPVAPSSFSTESPTEKPSASSETTVPAMETMTGDTQRVRGAPFAPEFAPPQKEAAPPRTPPAMPAPFSLNNLSEDRLTKPSSLPHQEREYALGDDGETLEEKKYEADPYREPVE